MKKVILYIIMMVITSSIFGQSIFTVTKTTDPNPFQYPFNNDDNLCDPEMYGTLQWAINKANDDNAESIIEFNIPGSGPHEIALNYYLPQIKSSTTIDATTQVGYTEGNPAIIVSGQEKQNSIFNVYNTDITIKGLKITSFAQNGILLQECSNSFITDNIISNYSLYSPTTPFIGVFINGCSNVSVFGNEIEITLDESVQNVTKSYGIYASKSTNCTIGGTDTGLGNTIKNCKTYGVFLNSTQETKISGNAIFDNGKAIYLNYSNNDIQPPIITDYQNGILSGTALPNSTIEIFGSTGEENANEYLVSTDADGGGEWLVEVSTFFDFISATQTDSNNSTSGLKEKLTREICAYYAWNVLIPSNNSNSLGQDFQIYDPNFIPDLRCCDGEPCINEEGCFWLTTPNEIATINDYYNQPCHTNVQIQCSICVDDNVPLYIHAGYNPNIHAYEWYYTSSGVLETSDPTIISFNANLAGIGTHTITYCSVCDLNQSIGTQYLCRTAIITVYGPDATITPTGPLCTDNPVVNLNTATPGGVWSGNGIINSFTGAFDPAIAGPGNHTINYYIEIDGCSDEDEITITVYESPNPTVSDIQDCEGEDVTFLAFNNFTTASVSNSWEGPNGNGPNTNVWFLENIQSFMEGEYIITVEYDYGDKVCTETATGHLTVYEAPVISFNDPVICNGNPTPLTASGGIEYTWEDELGNSLGATPTINITESGTYIVEVTDTHGCSAESSIYVSGSNLILDNITTNTCDNSDDGSITVIVTGGELPYFYNWTGPGTLLPNSPSLNNLPAGTYYLTVTDQNSCSLTAEYTVGTIESPTISFENIVPSCTNISENGSATIVLNGGTGTEFQFLWPNGETTETASQLNVGPNTVTVTDEYNCSITATVIIPISNLSADVITSNSIVCLGGNPATITAIPSGGIAPYTYNWSESLGNLNEYDVTPITTTEYWVTVTDAHNCTATASVEIEVVEIEVIIKKPIHEICYGFSASLSAHATGTNTDVSYSWSPNESLENPNTQFPVASPTETTTYTVTVEDENGCQGTGQVIVIVHPLPIITVSGPSEICAGYEFQLQVSGAVEYLWESSSSTAIISDIESANPTVVIDETTTFTVSGWSEFDCKSFTTITVNALENPTPILLVENNPVCIDDDFIIDLLNEDFNTYAWVGPNGYTNTTPDVLINNVTEANAGIYTVTVEYSNGCTNSAEVNIETHSFVAHAGNHSHCAGDELVLFARPSGLVSYHWEGPNGYNATYDVYEHHIPNASLDMSGTYYVTITDQYGCTASSQTTVIINENPIVNLGDDIQICYSQSIQLGANLTISGGTPTYSYEWAPNDEQLSDHQVANPIATPLSTTLYTLTVSDLHSCSGTDEILITVDQIVDLSASYNTPVCQYDELQLFAQPDGLGYSWQGPYGFTSTEQNPIVTTSANLYNSGTYTLTATNLNECSSSVNIEIEINPLPAVFTGPDQIICEGTNLTLEGGIDELAEYHWTGPNGFESFEQNPTVSYTATTNMQGIYTLIASNEFGCTASASTSINILPIPQSASFDLPPCIYINNPYQFINLGNNDASFDYTWNFGDGIISNEAAPVHEFQNEGYHCLSLTVENQCGISSYSTEPVFLYPNECACENVYGTVNRVIDNSNVNWDDTWSPVQKDIIIESGAKLTVTNQTIQFGPEGRIIVKQGGKLIITQSSTLRGLSNCENMWQGIEVWGDHMSNPDDVIQGHVKIEAGSNTIRDAHIGILAGARNMDNVCNMNLLLAFNSDYSGGFIRNKEKLNFINNGIGIKLLKKHPGYEGTGSHIGYQTMHFFTETGGLNDNNYNSITGANPYPNRHNPWAGKANNLQRTDVGIWMEGIKLTKLINSTFTNLQYGILAYNSYFNVIRTNFDNAVYGIKIDNSNTSLNNGHEIVGCKFTNIIGTGDDDIEDFTSAGIFINSSLNANIHGNVFGEQQSSQSENNFGIFTFNSLSMNINQNKFEGMKKGIFTGNLFWIVVGPFYLWQPVTDLPTNKIGAGLSSYYDISALPDWGGNTFIKCNTSIYTFLINNNLILKCNNCQNDDVNPEAYYVNFQNEGIMANIGAPPLLFNFFNLNYKRPGGNEFMPDYQADQGFYKTIMSNNEYEYYAHQGPSRVIPTSHSDSQIDMENHIHTSSYQKPENKIACSPFQIFPIPMPYIVINPITGGKNYPYKHLDSLTNQIDSLSFIKEELILNLDKGKTQELLNDIYGNSPRGKLKNKLIANSPLSDTVVFALLTEYPLSHGNFKNAMSINLPVSQNLTSLFYDVMDQIPSGISKQLIPLQGVNFNYPNITSINREIEHLNLERGYVLNQLLNHLTDSVNNRRDDALLLLELEGTDWAKATLSASYIEDGEYDIAREKLLQIQSNDPLAQEFIDYQNLMIDIFEEGRTVYQMDSNEIAYIRELAYKCPAGLASTNAQAILSLLYRENVPICPMMVGTRSISDNSNNIFLDDRYCKPIEDIMLGDNYPDPASDHTIIPYYLPDEINGIMEIYDAMGKIISVYNLHQGDNQLNIDTQGLQPGIYTYTLITKEYKTVSKKFVIYR
ncbi:MAG: PKD domain-containing protein [Bacteroidales bacterium]|nr:PKD domain-containing protein [Bacteroidales bacterium]